LASFDEHEPEAVRMMHCEWIVEYPEVIAPGNWANRANLQPELLKLALMGAPGRGVWGYVILGDRWR
jgi:hypothetical protein